MKKNLVVITLLLIAISLGSTAATAGKKGHSKKVQQNDVFESIEQNRWGRALMKLKKEVEENPNSAKLWNNLAVAYEANALFGQAYSAYEKSIEIDRENNVAEEIASCNYKSFMNFYERTGNAPPKENWKVVTCRGQNANALFHLGTLPRTGLTGNEPIALMKSITSVGENSARADFDANEEFEGYLKNLLKKSGLNLKEVGSNIRYPTNDIKELGEKHMEYWKVVAKETQATVIVITSINFTVHNQSGYVEKEYISEFTGLTEVIQERVEHAGIELDILVYVINTETEEYFSENLKDFQNFDSQYVDSLKGLFNSLYSLEERLRGLFKVVWQPAKRKVFRWV